jgi:peptidoglycan/LPS O-acetylase OafA/YrhL
MVLGSHCIFTAGFPHNLLPIFNWVFDGNLGVRTFFIISGFLITWLMLIEHDRSGRVSLKRFYARRAIRILPVYFAFLGTLAALSALTPFRQAVGTWLCNITFITNVCATFSWTSAHLWSLAVEEQFYLLWPTVFVLFGLGKSLRTSLLILSLPLLIAPIARVITYLGVAPAAVAPLFYGFSFFNYFDSLAIGCACAVLLSRRRDFVQHWTTARPRLMFFGAIVLIVVPYVLSHCLLAGIFTVPLGNTCEGVGVAILIMQSVMRPRLGVYRVLNHPLIRQIGVLSYSLYIWQMVFCTNPRTFGLGDVWWMSYPFWLLPVILVALVSYYGLERPFLRLRARLRTSESPRLMPNTALIDPAINVGLVLSLPNESV